MITSVNASALAVHVGREVVVPLIGDYGHETATGTLDEVKIVSVIGVARLVYACVNGTVYTLRATDEVLLLTTGRTVKARNLNATHYGRKVQAHSTVTGHTVLGTLDSVVLVVAHGQATVELGVIGGDMPLVLRPEDEVTLL